MHNIVHLATDALALAITFVLPARQQVDGVFGLGVLYAVIFVALLSSPNLFGILSCKVRLADQLFHIGLAGWPSVPRSTAPVGLGWSGRAAGQAG